MCVLIVLAFVVSVNSDSIAGGPGEPVRARRFTRDAGIWQAKRTGIDAGRSGISEESACQGRMNDVSEHGRPRWSL